MRDLSTTWIQRLIHLGNLRTLLARKGLHAPSQVPDDGRSYRSIHDIDVQNARHQHSIPCGPGGVITDYVPFYFGRRSPRLLRLHTGQVAGYEDGQGSLLYLVSSVGDIQREQLGFVFSDGHGLARFTRWFADPADLDQLDWNVVHADYWASDDSDNDRQRRKQAELLVHRFCPWSALRGIAVIDDRVRRRVEEVLANQPEELRLPVAVRRKWYY
jgi:ssDNA thymidine ADP-ribosyltransferase, DarT